MKKLTVISAFAGLVAASTFAFGTSEAATMVSRLVSPAPSTSRAGDNLLPAPSTTRTGDNFLPAPSTDRHGDNLVPVPPTDRQGDS